MLYTGTCQIPREKTGYPSAKYRSDVTYTSDKIFLQTFHFNFCLLSDRKQLGFA